MEGPDQRAGRLILGLETSCDETAAAVVTDDGRILSNIVSSQAELHARFGGVVPEVASRRHLELVVPVLREALAEAGTELEGLDSVAVTQGPGLVGALLVGLSAAKAVAWANHLPLIPVNHLHGHVGSLYLKPEPVEPPFLCLLARAAIDRLAGEGDPGAYDFPVARVPGLDFSFSGLKTALLYAVRDLSDPELVRRRADLAASYQRAIVRALVAGAHEAAELLGAPSIAVVGGVAANSELRAALPEAAFAPLPLCTDNAAMIASAARYAEAVPCPSYLALDAYASG